MGEEKQPLRIFVVSGGVGASGEQVLNTVLAQFPDSRVEVKTIGNVREAAQIDDVVELAKSANGIIVFTLVDSELGKHLEVHAKKQGVPSVDLVGPLQEILSERLGVSPLCRPGAFRQLHREYFDRVSAIEYAMAHDDGCQQETWHQADLLLLGVSRTGKTPLSIYLSVLGWKVANFPLVPELPVPDSLFRLEKTRVIGLTIMPDRLLAFRRHRSSLLGVGGATPYVDPLQITKEVEFAESLFRRGGFGIIDVTDKPVEASANELIRRFGSSLGGQRIPPL